MIEGMIRGAGLEPKYPIKISAIQEGMQNARNNWNRGGGPNGPPALVEIPVLRPAPTALRQTGIPNPLPSLRR